MSATARDEMAGTGNVHAGRQAHLLFDVGDARCALPLSRVREVVRCPTIVGVPLGPEGLAGLANLRGVVTAIVGLRHILGFPEVVAGDAARVAVIESGFPGGLLVDRLLGILDVDPSRIEAGGDSVEEADADSGTPVPQDHVAGWVRGAQGAPTILILDADSILSSALAPRPRAALGRAAVAPVPARPLPSSEAGERQLISFEVDRQEYALPIEHVREIVRMPESVSRVPHARSHHLGVVSLRDRLMPLVSLRALLGLPGVPLDQRARVVVVRLDASTTVGLDVNTTVGLDANTTVGLVVDAASDVLRIRDDVADAVPSLFGHETGEDIEAICRLDGGRRLVSILSAGRLLRSDAVARAIEAGATRQQAAQEDEAVSGTGPEPEHEVEPFVVFRIGRESYGLPVQAVDEIMRVPDLIHVPGAPAHMAGVTNRRGTVLPVVDQRRRFGLPEAPSSASKHVIVATIGTVQAGLLVDAATGVLRIPAHAITPAPEFSSQHTQVVSRVANLDTGMVLLLAPERLLSFEELGRLTEASAGIPADPAEYASE